VWCYTPRVNRPSGEVRQLSLFVVFTHVTFALTTVAIRHVGAQTRQTVQTYQIQSAQRISEAFRLLHERIECLLPVPVTAVHMTKGRRSRPWRLQLRH